MDKREYKNMWVHIEHTEGKVSSAALELCCEIRKLCDQSGDKLIGVIAEAIPEGELEKLKECGIDGAIEVSGTGMSATIPRRFQISMSSFPRSTSPQRYSSARPRTAETLRRTLQRALRQAAHQMQQNLYIIPKRPI